MFQFGQMWYHSALLIMMVDITARSPIQLIILSVLYIIMAIVNATLFGLLFDMIEVLNQRDNEFQNFLDNANTAMANLELKPAIREKVRSYIINTYETKTSQAELKEFTSSMPISKNRMIISLNFDKALSGSVSFVGLRIYFRDYYRKKVSKAITSDLPDHNSTID